MSRRIDRYAPRLPSLGGVRCVIVSLCALGAALLGCSVGAVDSSGSVGSSASSGTVVVGITSDLIPGIDIARLRVVLRADGRVVRDQVFKANVLDPPFVFPTELRFSDLPAGTKVDIRLEAYTSYFSDEEPLLVREASTHIVLGKILLLRARIEQECIPNFRLAGDLLAPTCIEPDTCIAGACVDPYVPPDRLEAYSPTWAEVFADACKPAEPGDPIVAIGEGQTAFRPISQEDVVQVEAGPQGGYHVWVSIRMKNLHQAGSQTFVDVYELGADEPLVSFAWAQSYSALADGSCELLGLRCQLTLQSAMDVQGLLGDTLRVTARIADSAGDVGAGEQLITLSKDIVKP